MNKIETDLTDVFIIEPRIFTDERGAFIKTFNVGTFNQLGLDFQLAESYYSTSKKDVIRGMHFQTPDQDHTKIVYVTSGSITDVILDIRKGSPTFGKHISLELNDVNRRIVYIPSGFAHGFLAHTDDTCVVYNQSTGYSPEHDSGIHYDSFGFDWNIASPVTSSRDLQFPRLDEFDSPFEYGKA